MHKTLNQALYNTTPVIVDGVFMCYVCRQLFPMVIPFKPPAWFERGGRLYRAGLCRNDAGDCLHTDDEVASARMTIWYSPKPTDIPNFVDKVAERLWEEFDDYSDPEKDEFENVKPTTKEWYKSKAREIMALIKP